MHDPENTVGQQGHLRQAVAAKTRHVLPSLGSWVSVHLFSAGQDYCLMWVAETWNELFQRQESWCREAAQSALRQWWACPGRIIHPNTKKAPQRNMLSSDVSPPSLPSHLDFS